MEHEGVPGSGPGDPKCGECDSDRIFLSKVYEGPYENTRKWMDDFHSYATRQVLEIKKWYVWYTTS